MGTKISCAGSYVFKDKNDIFLAPMLVWVHVDFDNTALNSVFQDYVKVSCLISRFRQVSTSDLMTNGDTTTRQ